jgi:hypothetical protein
VSLLLDVLQVLPRRAAGRILLAHVAEAAGKLGQPLSVSAFSKPVNLEVIRLQKDWAREKSDYRFCIEQGFFGVSGNCN